MKRGREGEGVVGRKREGKREGREGVERERGVCGQKEREVEREGRKGVVEREKGKMRNRGREKEKRGDGERERER